MSRREMAQIKYRIAGAAAKALTDLGQTDKLAEANEKVEEAYAELIKAEQDEKAETEGMLSDLVAARFVYDMSMTALRILQKKSASAEKIAEAGRLSDKAFDLIVRAARGEKVSTDEKAQT